MPKVTERVDQAGNTIRVGDMVSFSKSEGHTVIGKVTHLGYKKVTLEASSTGGDTNTFTVDVGSVKKYV